MNDSFAETLARIRAQKGLTQRDLAAMIGVSWSQISKYESGKSKPRMKILWRLEEALECPGRLSGSSEEDEVSVSVPAELWERMVQAAADAEMTMEEYKEFFIARLITQSLDESIGIQPPLLFSKRDIEKAQARMKPGELHAAQEKRIAELRDGVDAVARALADNHKSN